MTPLETLIDQQAKLLRRIEDLMARSPDKEFVYGSYSPKSSRENTSFDRVKSWEFKLPAASPFGNQDFNLDADVKAVTVSWIFNQANAQSMLPTRTLLCTFGKTPNFDPVSSASFPIFPVLFTNQLAAVAPPGALGSDFVAAYQRTFPVIQPWLRISLINGQTAAVESANVNTFSSYRDLLRVTSMGY